MTPLRQRMLEDMQMRNFSPHTRKAYVRAVAQLALYYKRSPDQLDTEQVRAYLLHLINDHHVSPSTFNQVRCGPCGFFYRVSSTATGPWTASSARRRKKLRDRPQPRRGPPPARRGPPAQVPGHPRDSRRRLATSRTRRPLKVLRHRQPAYGHIRVRQGKGRKDRYVMLSSTLLATLREYWKSIPALRLALHKPGTRRSSSPTRTVANICQSAGRRQRLARPNLAAHACGIHLRHAPA